MRILAVSGSLQARSSNGALVEAARTASPPGVEIDVYQELASLPAYNSDLDVDPLPVAVADWRASLAAAGGVLIACPEFGHALPGSLKNAIDWVISSGELVGTPVAVTCAAAGPGRGEKGLASLVGILRALDARVIGGEPIVRGVLGPAGEIADPAALAAIEALVAQLVAAR